MSRDNAKEGTGIGRFPQPGGRAKADLAGLAIAAAILILAIGIGWDATTYTVRRSYAQFGPDIFPYIVAAGLIVLGITTAVMAFRDGFPERESINLPALTWLMGALAAMIVCLYAQLGFIISSAALFGMAARGMGRTPLWLTLAVGVLVSVFLYLLFQYGLSLSLPRGLLENTINGFLRA